MKDNFDFLKKVDKELFTLIEEAQRLFRDEYFIQSIVQARIFAENVAKKILGETASDMTFDNILHCLKDKIQTEREKEFIDDLFFIKKEGNACAHGQDATASGALEVIRRCFEVAINYSYSKKKDEAIDKLQFDETLLITGKPRKEIKLIDKYLERAELAQKEALLNEKQGEFKDKLEKNEDGFKDKNRISNTSKYKKTKKQLTPTQIKVKEKIKSAKKDLKVNIEKKDKPKKTIKKQTKKQKQQKKKTLKLILFLSFVTISLILLSKMIFF